MTWTYAPDIEESILSALSTIFTTELMNLSGDSLSLKTLRASPLQDDPTLSAPFLTYGPDMEKGLRPVKEGREEEEYGCVEIGGPVRFLRFYAVTFGTPIVTTREAAYAQINNLANRVARVLMKYFDLAGVSAYGPLTSPDQSEVIEGANPRLIDDIKTNLEGGEQTWFGKGSITFHYPVSVYVQYRVFTGGSLAY